MSYKNLLLLLLCISFLGTELYSQDLIEPRQDWEKTLETSLIEQGFQNISVKKEAKQLILDYENRLYRFEAKAIKVLIQKAFDFDLPQGLDTLIIVSRRLQIPIIYSKISLNHHKTYKEGKITFSSLAQHLVSSQDIPKSIRKNKTLKNRGNYRFELELIPHLNLALGGFPDPIIHRINLLPTLNYYLWKGGQIKLQGVLPISSEYDLPGEKMLRPGILALSQSLRLPQNTYVQGAIGYFTSNRYGASIDLNKFFWNGKLLLFGHLGYTGYASYPKKFGREIAESGWEYEDINYTDYKVGINYWLQKFNLNVSLSYGKVLYGRKMLRLDVSQQFNEIDIGFFALESNKGRNYGMRLRIPIFPKKYWKPKRFSIRPARYFQYDYRTSQGIIKEYSTGDDLIYLHRHLQPGFIVNQLSKNIKL